MCKEAQVGSIRSNFGRHENSIWNGLETRQGGSGGPICVFGAPFSMLASLPQPACHRSNKGRPLPAAVLGLEEGHLALGRKLLDSFLHHLGEAVERAERNRRSSGLLLSPSPHWAFFCFHFSFLALQQKCQQSSTLNRFYKSFLGLF